MRAAAWKIRKTGESSVLVDIAREIKDGKFTGKVFSPIVLTGYVPDLLKSISMMSDECELAGTGYCGKGHKEWVKVSDGGPYIKARIRLGLKRRKTDA